MPSVFLSPSLQEYNLYYDNAGSEEYYMNLIADAMEPYLVSSGISYTRNRISGTLSQAIADSNSGVYDLHLALHSNAAPPNLSGELTGADFYFYMPSIAGRDAASVLAANYRTIYPDPDKVRIMPTTSLAELTRTRAPSVLAELAYHDNAADANFLRENIGAIAANLVQGLCLYFDIPFVTPDEAADMLPQTNATVVTETDDLLIRNAPLSGAPVIGRMKKGERCTAYPLNDDWSVVSYRGLVGFAASRYLQYD